MDIKEWFRSVEPTIRDSESLIVASFEGRPIIGKTSLDEDALAAAAATMVDKTLKFGLSTDYIIMESGDQRVIIVWKEPYIIASIGKEFTIEFMNDMKELLFK